MNPFGCWDWWGYTNFNYAVKAGRQITTIKAMLDRLTSRHIPNQQAADATTQPRAVVNDVSDTGVALAWTPIAGARGYMVAREEAGDAVFAPIGSVAQPSFGDMGLSPTTSYNYTITVTGSSDGGGPNALAVTAVTLPVAPRCDTPGSCAVP